MTKRALPKKAPGSSPKLDESALRLLEEDVKARSWVAHGQRSEYLYVACGVKVSEATICRTVKRRLWSSRKEINGSEREGRVAKVGVASDHRHT